MPLNIDWQQILLHFFNFAILMGGLYFLLYSPVKKFMDERLETYKKMDDDARISLNKAESLKGEYEEKLAAADKEIRDRNEAARNELDSEINEKKAQTKAEAERIIKEAHEKALSEHDKMIMDAKEDMVDLAVEMTEKILVSSEDPYDQFLEIAEKHLNK